MADLNRVSGVGFGVSQRLARGLQTLVRKLNPNEDFPMLRNSTARAGKVSYGIIAWLLGAPTIVIIIALFVGGIFKF